MFGSGHKIKIEDELYQKLKVASASLGCSVEELVVQMLSREVDKIVFQGSKKEMSPEEVAALENSLKGLGYLE